MMFILFALPLLVAVALLAYAWLAYPVLLLACRNKHARQPSAPLDNIKHTHLNPLPPVAIVIAAWNEESVIADRIRNFRSVNYPIERLRVLIGTDGCTDQTAQQAREAAGKIAPLTVNVYEFPTNRGKATVLKDLVHEAITSSQDAAPELLIFSDANTSFHPDTLALLVRHFANPLVGGVCGRLLFSQQGSNEAERSYWNLETRLKTREAALDSCLGANGAVYAIRPNLFWQDLPDETIIDDFVIGMKVREAGFIMRYDPEAVAEEDLPETADEWKRRVRIGSGAYQALGWCRACLHPRFGYFAWFFWSHKVLRWFTPHLVLVSGICSALILLQQPYTQPYLIRILAVAVLLALALATLSSLAGILIRRSFARPPAGRLIRLLFLLEHLTTMQLALFVGFIRFCRGNLSGSWARTPRKAPAA